MQLNACSHLRASCTGLGLRDLSTSVTGRSARLSPTVQPVSLPTAVLSWSIVPLFLPLITPANVHPITIKHHQLTPCDRRSDTYYGQANAHVRVDLHHSRFFKFIPVHVHYHMDLRKFFYIVPVFPPPITIKIELHFGLGRRPCTYWQFSTHSMAIGESNQNVAGKRISILRRFAAIVYSA